MFGVWEHVWRGRGLVLMYFLWGVSGGYNQKGEGGLYPRYLFATLSNIGTYLIDRSNSGTTFSKLTLEVTDHPHREPGWYEMVRIRGTNADS